MPLYRESTKNCYNVQMCHKQNIKICFHIKDCIRENTMPMTLTCQQSKQHLSIVNEIQSQN